MKLRIRENYIIILPVDILTGVARQLLGPHDTLLCVLIQQLHEYLSPKMYNDIMSDTRLDRMFHYFELFLDFLWNKNSDLSAFRMSYIDMVTVLLGLLRASREGSWDLHVACICYMLP